MKVSDKRAYSASIVFVFFLFISVFSPFSVSAVQLTSRSIVIGTSVASANTQHRFNFTIPSVSTVGSIKFEYCTNSPLVNSPCTIPVGLNVGAANLTSQSGETGFSVDGLTTSNMLVISRSASLTSAIPVTYNFTNITNPSSNTTIFVRITTYATTDTSGAYTDDGSVAFATVPNVTVNGYVPPYLSFCVGVTVAGDCSSASGEFLNFGELSQLTPKYLTSQFAGATNDPGGFTTSVTGITMTSGSNVIPALAVPSTSQPGTSQFGMNLRANSSPAVGNNPSGVGTSTIVSDFGIPNQFTFKNQVITQSTLPTEFNVFTVSYVVNISSSQAPGIYNTTLTYIAVAAF